MTAFKSGISIPCLLVAACAAPVTAPHPRFSDPALCETPAAMEAGSKGDIRVEDLLASEEAYIKDWHYYNLRRSPDILSDTAEAVRIIISDMRFSSWDLILLEISKTELSKNQYRYEITAVTEGERDFPREGVTEQPIITYEAQITEAEYQHLQTDYAALTGMPARRGGGWCDHCLAMRIDSSGISGGKPRSLLANDEDILADTAYARMVLHAVVKKFSELKPLAGRISKTFDLIEEEHSQAH